MRFAFLWLAIILISKDSYADILLCRKTVYATAGSSSIDIDRISTLGVGMITRANFRNTFIPLLDNEGAVIVSYRGERFVAFNSFFMIHDSEQAKSVYTQLAGDHVSPRVSALLQSYRDRDGESHGFQNARIGGEPFTTIPKFNSLVRDKMLNAQNPFHFVIIKDRDGSDLFAFIHLGPEPVQPSEPKSQSVPPAPALERQAVQMPADPAPRPSPKPRPVQQMPRRRAGDLFGKVGGL